MTDDEDDDARARRERAEALRKRIAQKRASGAHDAPPPSSPHEFVEDSMRDRESSDEEEES
jgi:hypothetical protein